jgi:hypothetical protein
MEELKKDILSHYKDSKCKLTAKPYVRFEGEEGVGCGATREFLLCAMKIMQVLVEAEDILCTGSEGIL